MEATDVQVTIHLSLMPRLSMVELNVYSPTCLHVRCLIEHRIIFTCNKSESTICNRAINQSNNMSRNMLLLLLRFHYWAYFCFLQGLFECIRVYYICFIYNGVVFKTGRNVTECVVKQQWKWLKVLIGKLTRTLEQRITIINIVVFGKNIHEESIKATRELKNIVT